MAHIKIVKIKKNVTAKTLGCKISHFMIYIAGEDLRVIEETREEYTVKDGSDQQWILKKTDVEVVQNTIKVKEVANG